MKDRFEFYFDSEMCGPETEISFNRFIECLDEAVEHYNTDKCFVDDNGQVHPHIYKYEDGEIVTWEHFQPDLFLLDKKLKRLIRLKIDGFDNEKIFNLEFQEKIDFKSILELVDGNKFEFDDKKIEHHKYQTKDLELVKYWYKLIFESADGDELNHLLDSINKK